MMACSTLRPEFARMCRRSRRDSADAGRRDAFLQNLPKAVGVLPGHEVALCGQGHDGSQRQRRLPVNVLLRQPAQVRRAGRGGWRRKPAGSPRRSRPFQDSLQALGQRFMSPGPPPAERAAARCPGWCWSTRPGAWPEWRRKWFGRRIADRHVSKPERWRRHF